jgi:hypothetical protein
MVYWSRIMCIFYNQQDTTYTMFFIIISALHVLGGFSTHHQELIKLYVQPWLLSCFPGLYRSCGWVGKTAWNMQSADNNKEHCISCISLVIENTHLAMHGSMDVKKDQELRFGKNRVIHCIVKMQHPQTHLPFFSSSLSNSIFQNIQTQYLM